jgi:putative transposase
MSKYQNKYRNGTIRAQWWDYGENAAYFVTICTKNRIHYFGEIENKQMNYSEIGKIVESYWQEIPKQFPYTKLEAFVVMPNHLHGILIIDKPLKNQSLKIETQEIDKGGFAGIKNPMLNENLSRILRWYKGRCSFEIRKIGFDFQWQSRFYDHIIRNESAFGRISDYIVNNPSNWKEDTFHIDNFEKSKFGKE